MIFIKKIFLTLFLVTLLFNNAIADEKFIIEDIIIKGLKRVDKGVVYSYLPFEVGDIFDTSITPELIKSLFKTKFFDDVVIEREGNILVFNFKERPTIADIDFIGLESIPEEQLNKILEAANIVPGSIYDSSILDRIKSELREQNYARGKYTSDIKIEETLLSDNRIYLKVTVNEGVSARIKQIKIIGNKTFSDENLKSNFETSLTKWYMFWTTSGVYSSPILIGDLDRLKSFYQDQGFMDFSIESTQVSLNQSKEEVYITININEGRQYEINKIYVSGKLIFSIEQIADLFEITTGEYISRAKIMKTVENIKSKLSIEGYAFSNIKPIPEKIQDSNKVDINFYIDSGKRVYVRRINILGNNVTSDEVFRRELRQMEGGFYSLNSINQSKARLKRLSYIENIFIDEIRVPGSDDQVDLNVKIVEKMSGNFSLGAGFGGSGTGVSLNVGVEQDNFLGSGNKVAFSINTAKTTRTYSFNFFNPYHNLDNVSRSFGFNLQNQDTTNTTTVSSYEADKFGLNYSYGIPLTEDNRFNLQLSYINWKVKILESSPQQIQQFVSEEGSTFNNFSINATYTQDTRDSAVYTRSGHKTSLGSEIYLPGSGLEFYKINFEKDSYNIIDKDDDIILRLKGSIDFGDGYGGTKQLPFYEKYKMGGPRSVRGYEKNNLSPKDSNGMPFGGDFAIMGGVEVIFPSPFFENPNLRTALFADIGNSFEKWDDFEFSDLKGSFGLAVKYLSAFGPIVVNISIPINDDESDKTEGFQFNLGTD